MACPIFSARFAWLTISKIGVLYLFRIHYPEMNICMQQWHCEQSLKKIGPIPVQKEVRWPFDSA
jgi:hypothetical protein